MQMDEVTISYHNADVGRSYCSRLRLSLHVQPVIELTATHLH